MQVSERRFRLQYCLLVRSEEREIVLILLSFSCLFVISNLVPVENESRLRYNVLRELLDFAHPDILLEFEVC